MVPSSGQILAVAGIGLDGLQPPGSTFKMVTVSGVLSARIARRTTQFPYATHAMLDGVRCATPAARNAAAASNWHSRSPATPCSRRSA